MSDTVRSVLRSVSSGMKVLSDVHGEDCLSVFAVRAPDIRFKFRC